MFSGAYCITDKNVCGLIRKDGDLTKLYVLFCSIKHNILISSNQQISIRFKKHVFKVILFLFVAYGNFSKYVGRIEGTFITVTDNGTFLIYTIQRDCHNLYYILYVILVV